MTDTSMRYFHGEVKTENIYQSDARAQEIAGRVADEIMKLGGTIDVGRNFGESPALLIVSLPDNEKLDPAALVGEGIVFRQVGQMVVPAQTDHGIPSDVGQGPA